MELDIFIENERFTFSPVNELMNGWMQPAEET